MKKKGSASFILHPSSLAPAETRALAKHPLGRLAEDRDHVLDRNYVKTIVGVELDRNRMFGVEEHAVVLVKREILWADTETIRPVIVGISIESGSSMPPLVTFLSSSLRIRTRLPSGSTVSSFVFCV